MNSVKIKLSCGNGRYMLMSTNSTDHCLKFTKLQKLDAKFNYFYYFQVILAKLQSKIIFVWKFYTAIFFLDFSRLHYHTITLATGHNSRIASVAALEGDTQYFIIWNIGDHCLNFSINMIGFEKVGG